jgi:hypothetical protein
MIDLLVCQLKKMNKGAVGDFCQLRPIRVCFINTSMTPGTTSHCRAIRRLAQANDVTDIFKDEPGVLAIRMKRGRVVSPRMNNGRKSRIPRVRRLCDAVLSALACRY